MRAIGWVQGVQKKNIKSMQDLESKFKSTPFEIDKYNQQIIKGLFFILLLKTNIK